MQNSIGKSLLSASILLAVLFAYQNCGQMGGQSGSTSSSNSSNVSPNPNPNPSPGPSPAPSPNPSPAPSPSPTPYVFKDQWNMINGMGAPSGRIGSVSVWTGSKMLVFGGYSLSGVTITEYNDGAAYDPATNLWTPIANSPLAARHDATAVWTGSKMIVWGGLSQPNSVSYNDGAMYDPATNTWTAMSSVGAPSARVYNTATWTGSKMIVFGGHRYSPTVANFNDGAIYDPATNTWTAISTSGAPSVRYAHSAVWTGNKMIVFGGYGATALNSGGIYDPSNNSWTAISITGAPSARNAHSAIWTGSLMLVFGGYNNVPNLAVFNTGGAYNPATNTWTALPTTGAPSARYAHSAFWSGSKMIIHGGYNGSAVLNTGALFDPATGTWSSMSSTGAPSARAATAAVWTGDRMIVYGGSGPSGYFLDGAYYQ